MQNARRVRSDRKEEEERVGGAGYPLETECIRLDAVSPLGVTAALSGAVWRTGWPSTALIVSQVEETRKPLDLFRATVQPNKARPPIIS